MGLQGVELMMAIEDEFGIAFTDQEAERMVTVADLNAAVLEKLRAGQRIVDERRCVSSHLFYRLRRALMEAWGVPRAEVRLEARLDNLLPRKGRKACWSGLRDSLALELPELSLPYWMSWTIVGFAFAVALGVVIFIIPAADTLSDRIFSGIGFLFGTVLVWLLIFAGLAWFFDPFALCIPREYRTVREAVLTLQQRHFGKLQPAGAGMDREEVWNKLVQLITSELQVKPEAVKPEAKIWDDLCR